MSAVILHRLLGLCVALNLLIVGIACAFVLIMPTTGEPLVTSWSITSTNERIDLLSGFPNRVSAIIGAGTLRTESTDLIHFLWRFVDVLVVGALALVSLELLRRIVGDVRSSRPFSNGAEKRLYGIAASLTGLATWTALSPLIWVSWLLEIDPASGFERTGYSTFASSGGDELRVWLDVDWGLVVAALVCVVLGRVFAIGAQLQNDSDEIV